MVIWIPWLRIPIFNFIIFYSILTAILERKCELNTWTKSISTKLVVVRKLPHILIYQIIRCACDDFAHIPQFQRRRLVQRLRGSKIAKSETWLCKSRYRGTTQKCCRLSYKFKQGPDIKWGGGPGGFQTCVAISNVPDV